MTIKAIEEFVFDVNQKEVDCILYRSLQEIDDKMNFTHYMIFKDKNAEEIHKQTLWVKKFVETLYPLLEVETVFTDMKIIGNG